MKQLALTLSACAGPTFGNFVIGANAEVVNALQAVARGDHAERFVYLWGAPGSGRTHLLAAVVAASARTPALLAQYVPAFDPRFLGLYGDAEATARTAKEFKIIYQKVPGSSAGTYTMDHSAGTYVFDPQGRLRLYVANGQGADVFAHDLRELLRAG